MTASWLPPLTKRLLPLVLVGLAYWVAAKLSLNLALVHGQVTPVWPPTGIAVVALMVVGRRTWPAILLAALAVNLPLGPSPLGAALIATGNTLAPLASAELLGRLNFHLELDRLADAAAIIAAALIGMTISATFGSLVLLLSGSVSSPGFWATWAVWWTGDAMGVLLVAPFLLSLMRRPLWPAWPWWRPFELLALLAMVAVVTYILFQNRLRIEYLVFPLIIAAAWRFRLRGAAPAALIASGVAIWAAVHGSGPFANESLLQKMVTLQVFNVSVALTSFVLASFVDTRERSAEMSRLYVSAQLASDAKSAFLNLAAHELRTPISVINGYLSMLSDGSLGPPPAGWVSPLEVLSTKTHELNKIVGDLLEASRMEAEALPGARTTLDLRETVKAGVARARPRAALLGAELAVELPSEPVPVDGDASQLGRILDNLINNGMTYTVRPSRVSVSVAIVGTRAVVRVADNGVGIPGDQQDRVFERFQRGNDPSFNNVSGTGLGLFISRELAQGHGGSVVIESSDVGEGSVFALGLPLSVSAVVAGG